MLKLNIWASPLCFVCVPQAWCSLWNHLLRSYHLVHQPPLTSGRGSHIPSNVLGRAGKSHDCRTSLLVTLSLPLLHPTGCSAAATGEMCLRASAPQAFGPLPGQQGGSMFTKAWKQSFHVLDEMRAFHFLRRAEWLTESLHRPGSQIGSSELPVLCSWDISPLAEVCVLVICNPGSSYPAGQLGWHE